jgi:hypothetical protein
MSIFEKAWNIVKISPLEREIAAKYADSRDFPRPDVRSGRESEYDTYHDTEGPNICSHCFQGTLGPDVGRLDAEGFCPSCWEEATFGDWEDYSPPPGLRERTEAGERWQSSNPNKWQQYGSKPSHFECRHCGSTDLEFRMWVNQDREITDDCEEHPYCNVCEQETRVKT